MFEIALSVVSPPAASRSAMKPLISSTLIRFPFSSAFTILEMRSSRGSFWRSRIIGSMYSHISLRALMPRAKCSPPKPRPSISAWYHCTNWSSSSRGSPSMFEITRIGNWFENWLTRFTSPCCAASSTVFCIAWARIFVISSPAMRSMNGRKASSRLPTN